MLSLIAGSVVGSQFFFRCARAAGGTPITAWFTHAVEGQSCDRNHGAIMQYFLDWIKRDRPGGSAVGGATKMRISTERDERGLMEKIEFLGYATI